jgi:hypothetical protein
MLFRDRTFTDGEVVDLDGNRFEGCTFGDCAVRYSAAGGVFFDRCTFGENTKWVVNGAAMETIKFLTVMYQIGPGGKDLVETTFQQIRRGAHPIR